MSCSNHFHYSPNWTDNPEVTSGYLRQGKALISTILPSLNQQIFASRAQHPDSRLSTIQACLVHRAAAASNRTTSRNGLEIAFSRQLLQHIIQEPMTNTENACKIGTACRSFRSDNSQQYLEHIMCRFPAIWHFDTPPRRRSVQSPATGERQRESNASFEFPDA